jgi:trans-aconitate 2-methyltransferase
MSKKAAKDFAPIAQDYEFFSRHATEAREDAQALAQYLANLPVRPAPLTMLDFGCGDGDFTERLLRQAGWLPGQLRLVLVEPVEAARRQAAARLARFSAQPIVDWVALPSVLPALCDLILANHVFYYVPQLKSQMAALIAALADGGILLASIAGRSNALIEFWIVAFEILKMEIPYNTSEDVEAALQALDLQFEKHPVKYELAFPDIQANRLKILRFLLADHLPQLPMQPLLNLFDKYSTAGQIRMLTESDHYVIRR